MGLQPNLDTDLDTGAPDGFLRTGDNLMREYKSGTITQLPSGKWRGRVSAPDGRRISVTRDTEKQLKDELRSLAGKVASGAPVASTSHTVKTWMAIWLEESRPNLAPRTYEFYEGYIRRYINPQLGKIRLTALKPEDINRAVRYVQDRGLSPSTAGKVRTIMRRALKIAQRYGHVAVNVADLTDPPKQVEPERPSLTADQARAVLAACADDRMRARYHVALYLGLRQGELLGLRWQDIDLDTGALAVRQQIQRLNWRHGCQPARPELGKVAKCGKAKGVDCPQRHSGGIVARAPKSKAGRRTIPLPAPLLAELEAHRARQAAERLHAGSHWQDHGLVFAQPNGKPLDPAGDWRDWRAMLTSAGVPASGTHAARRTCATLLLEAGVDPRTVAEIIGHSSVQLTMDIYQQTGQAILRQGTDAISAALAAPAPVTTAVVTEPEPAAVPPAGNVVPIRQPIVYMSLTATARSISLTLPQLRKIINRGELRTIRHAGREMVREADLDEFLAKVRAEWG